MRCTCYHVPTMSKMIQIRNVPDDVHRKLKVRAAREGISLSELLLREAVRLADTPSLEEWVARVRAHPRVHLTRESIVEAVRAERDSQ